jgi:endonuclease-3
MKDTKNTKKIENLRVLCVLRGLRRKNLVTPEEKQRTKKIITLLRKEYPDMRCSLNFTNALELTIATILAAQCTDERVNIVTADLFRKYRKPEDYLKVPVTELEQDIRPTGFFRNKAKSIQGACKLIVEKFGGQVPQNFDDLLTLPGVARKTANVVMGNAFGVASGVVVDTHVTRITQLLGLTANSAPEKIERDLIELVPQKDWIDFPHLMIFHGRAVCIARRPQCDKCVLEKLCPSSLLKQ